MTGRSAGSWQVIAAVALMLPIHLGVVWGIVAAPPLTNPAHCRRAHG